MNEATKEALALEITKAKFSKNEKLDATSSYDWIRIYNQSLKEVEHEIKRNAKNLSILKLGFAR